MTKNVAPYRIRLKPRYVAYEPRLCQDGVTHHRWCRCPECQGGLPEHAVSENRGNSDLHYEEVAAIMTHVVMLRDRYTQLMTESHVGFVPSKRYNCSDTDACIEQQALFDVIKANPGLNKYELSDLTGLLPTRIDAGLRGLRMCDATRAFPRIRTVNAVERPRRWVIV
jgi:hypothetical protein